VRLSSEFSNVGDGFVFFLLWCLWRERNDRNFEDRERTVVEQKSLFFKTLYHWTVVLDYLNFLSFHYFLDIFSLSI
jgi:hypothetical protein